MPNHLISSKQFEKGQMAAMGRGYGTKSIDEE